MSGLTIDRFGEFFQALHGPDPYPWQMRLAERVETGDWPAAIDLPTGSGKTACIDIAVFALACQASLPTEQRTVPRRIFFCVNRRVIVDEAYNRAQRIAKAMLEAEKGEGVLADVADSLRKIAGAQSDGMKPPLDVLELRGGMYRDNRWARSITQPTIVCTTIDQLGSRLLFRGYGVSSNAAPIQAALIAYDSLILLDEAHISRPFFQTLAYVRQYLDSTKWAERDIGVKPTVVVPMTATPPVGIDSNEIIRILPGDRSKPQNRSLNLRLEARKLAELRATKDVVKEAVIVAREVAKNGSVAIGIIVNRVATAKGIYEELVKLREAEREKKRKIDPDAVIELVIGSMRPIDRDNQARRLSPLIGPQRPKPYSNQTSFVVATQCLEVGADYDFDALVTECASLDALRQRFGRLNRGGRKDADGTPIDARGVILTNKKDAKADEKLDETKPLDTIYGNALARTWNWLMQCATRVTAGSEPVEVIDFGIDAFDILLKDHGEDGRIPIALLAPSASLNAPVMLPAYVDFWCQTAPRPEPDPDVSLFLHGANPSEADVLVCWRADIGTDETHPKPEEWCDIVSLLPPTSAECMRVPIGRLRRWLADQMAQVEDHGDVLGVGEAREQGIDGNGCHLQSLQHRGVLWRGARENTPIRSAKDLRPGDTLVLPISAGGWNELGHIPHLEQVSTRSGVQRMVTLDFPAGTAGDAGSEMPDSADTNTKAVTETSWIDVAEVAFQAARDRLVVRLHPNLWPKTSSIGDVVERLADRHVRLSWPELQTFLRVLADEVERLEPERAGRMRQLANGSKPLSENYPDDRGVVLTSRQRGGADSVWFLPSLDDGVDELSRTQREQPVLLADHTDHVTDALSKSLPHLPLKVFADALQRAAQLHDLGKADERFQAMLRRTDRTDAWLLAGVTSALFAKSDSLPMTRNRRDVARRRAGLPDGFRHEMLSIQLAGRSARLPDDPVMRDLALHLIAAHHGHARPFAPVVTDEDLPPIEVAGITLSRDERLHLIPPHRLDSGVAERFWSLTRRFGWWGLAYLEAVLRLADQQASAAEDDGAYQNEDSNRVMETTA